MSRRRTDLSLDHLDAELIAAPFADPAGFSASVVTLDPQMKQAATSNLWRSVEQRLAPCFPGISLDELVARRDRVWFDAASTSPQPLTHILRRADLHMARAGVDGVGPATTRRRLRWLTFALPPDLPQAVTDPADPRPSEVSPIVARLLAEGVVEPHLHLGAALDFETLWITVQHALAASDSRAGMFQSPGAIFDDGRGLAGWLIRALIVRALLARALARDRVDVFITDLDPILARLPPTDRLMLVRVLQSIAGGQIGQGMPFPRLRALYRALVGIGPGLLKLPTDLDGITEADGIRPWFAPHDSRSSEASFIRRALSGIDSGRGAGVFQTLLWQVIRVRVLFYRHIVQRPMVKGLQWFTRTFGRIKPARGAMSRGALVASASRMSGPLRALEVRFTPDASPCALLARLESIARAAESGPPVGAILHLPRMRSPQHMAGRPAAFDSGSPAEPGHGQAFRFARYYRARRREAGALIDLLRSRPEVIELVRGIDVCADELAVPLWVLAPLLQAIRRTGRRAAARVSSQRRPIDPLRLMVHAGEDYTHMLGGLRRIDGFVEHLGLGEGDRLAHAIALGADVADWCDGAYGMPQAREDRLLDMLWAWRRVQVQPNGEIARWGSWLEAEIRRLGLAIFGCCVTPESLVAAWSCLHDGATLDAIGFPGKANWPMPRQPTLVLARRWLTDPGVFRRGRALEEIHPRKICPLIEHLQGQLRHQLSARSVVVEINPSSNLLIGAFSDLGQHPLWGLCPVEPDGRPSLQLTIGSDDPITFSTRLPAEYQLVYDTLTLAGVSSDRALAWLDAARRTSLRAQIAHAQHRPQIAHAQHPPQIAHAQHRPATGRRWPVSVTPLPAEFLPG